jgi:hypothetical protein
MVRSVSALAAAVVAMTIASGMAQSYNDYYDFEAREFFDELDARDYNDFDAREYFSELHAREYFTGLSEYEARSAYDLDAREYNAVVQYIRDTTPPTTHFGHHHFAAAAAVPAAIPAVPTLHTVTVTSTHVPTATACSKHELKEQAQTAKAKKADEHKAWVAQRKQRKEDEKKKKAAEKAAKHEAWVHRHDKNWKPTPTTTTTSVAAGATHNSTVPAVAGVHAAQAPLITPPPVLVAGPNVTISTVTAQGTVTVHVTTTAPVPACTKASRFHGIFKHHRRSDEEVGSLFAREYDFDDLD